MTRRLGTRTTKGATNSPSMLRTAALAACALVSVVHARSALEKPNIIMLFVGTASRRRMQSRSLPVHRRAPRPSD